MSTEFTFNSKADYCDASLTTASTSDGSYTLNSTSIKRRGRVPEATTVKSPHGRQGTIYWLERSFEIDGVKREVDEMRFKEKGEGIFTRRWSYQTKQWRVKFEYDAKAWNVFRVVDDTPEAQPSVVFRLYQAGIIGKSLPASVTFEPSVSESDAMFILMVLLYSELTQRVSPSFTSRFSDGIPQAIASMFYFS